MAIKIMSPVFIVLIILVAIIVIAAVIVGIIKSTIKSKARSFRAETQGLFGDAENMKFLLREAKDAADNFAAEEKSLCAMTGLMLPQIRRDFPEFDWDEYRVEVENRVKEFIKGQLPETETGEPAVHRTEISDYRRRDGGCTIDTQTSAGYRVDGKLIEKRYTTQITYVQDYQELPKGQTGTGLTCPNCGAPVKILGKKYCEYCGAGIREINRRVWKILNTREF